MFNAPYVFDVVDKIFSNANKQLFIIVNLKKKKRIKTKPFKISF